MGPGMRWVQVRPLAAATLLARARDMVPVHAGRNPEGNRARNGLPQKHGHHPAREGVQIGDIESAPWGRFVAFDDPDGNGIVLQESAAQG